jgi:hypothetical protein
VRVERLLISFALTFEWNSLVTLGVALVQDLAGHRSRLIPILDYVVVGRVSRGNCESDYVSAFERGWNSMEIPAMVEPFQELERPESGASSAGITGSMRLSITFSVSSFSPLKRNTTMPAAVEEERKMSHDYD